MDWLVTQPVAIGAITLVLMWLDWVLTVLQHRERARHSTNHYKSYPVDSVEGNPALQEAVARGRLFFPKHLLTALGVSLAVGFASSWMVVEVRPVFLGYMWGLYLVVCSTHLGNLIGYVAARRGVHGQVRIHQRTAYLVQAGRYAGLTALLAAVAALSGDSFVIGTAIAGLTSSIRQLAYLRRVPPISADESNARGCVTEGSTEAAEQGGGRRVTATSSGRDGVR
jgi:hypothetical protein